VFAFRAVSAVPNSVASGFPADEELHSVVRTDFAAESKNKEKIIMITTTLVVGDTLLSNTKLEREMTSIVSNQL
jgi:hypothetical protein